MIARVRLVIFDPAQAEQLPALRRFQRIFPALEQTYHRILACVLWLQQQHVDGRPVILVSKDLNMQLKARAVGIECLGLLRAADPGDRRALRRRSRYPLA